MLTSKSTISFTENNWKRIKNAKNKSKVINKALSFYFDSKAHLKQKEEDFILEEHKNYKKNGEIYSHDQVFSK